MAANRKPPRSPPVYRWAGPTVKLICDPLSFVNAPLLVVRNESASLVETRTVADDAVELDTTMNGVPPTSLPKSRTIAADDPPCGTVSEAVPVPCPTRTPAFETVPTVRTTRTGRTSSLAGPSTKLCQFGSVGQIGSAAMPADAVGSTAAISSLPDVS